MVRHMDKLLLRPEEVGEVIGLGRSKVYALLKSGDLPSIHIGASIRVSMDELRAWIDRRVTEGSARRPHVG